MKKHKGKLIWGVVILAAVGLMWLGGSQGEADTWADTDVACLPGGHQNAMMHIHAQLSVSVDGETQRVPGNVGINNACMAEVHTHNAGGQIHIESPDQSAELTLADFFVVWDQQLEREGYTREIIANGEEATPDHVFSDGDQVQVRFTSDESATSTQATSSEEATTTSDESEQ